ncbi:MAG: hypothetical protein DMD62_06170 [Gemmatimonadetes bacterium]|nr:MAG: hypothetical protein DMD62_06170 [Gemmatimonadota bacterium]
MLRTLGDRDAHGTRGRDVHTTGAFEQGASVEPREGSGNHANRGERRVAASHTRRMRNCGAKSALTRDLIQRAPDFSDGDELLGARVREEVVTEGEGLDRVARFARNDEQRAREVGRTARRANGFGIRAVQHVQVAGAERFRQHIGDETRPAHSADQRAGEAVRADGGGQRDVLIPLFERFLRRAHPREQIHERANIMRII